MKRALCAIMLLTALPPVFGADTPDARAAAAAAGAATPALLPQLMALFVPRRAAQAHFEETQTLSVLTQPLTSEGTLIYRAPDYLEQRALGPQRADLILDHGQLIAQLGAHRRTAPLSDYPQLAPLLEAIRATLAGDQRALEQLFTLTLGGTLSSWELHLTPRDSAAGSVIRSIELLGTGAQIQQVRFTRSNGDHTDMRIEPMRADSKSSGSAEAQ
jgi:hypothetical protein